MAAPVRLAVRVGAMRQRAIQGELNSDRVVDLRAELLPDVEACMQACEPFGLDLSSVREWDGAGFQLLLATDRSLREAGSALHLQGASAELVAALTRYGMNACLSNSGSPRS